MKYFITSHDGEVLGPHGLPFLRRLHAAGGIGPATKVCQEGTENWLPLDSILKPGEVRTEEQHLASIRDRSCYKNLRRGIKVMAGILILAKAAMIVVGVVGSGTASLFSSKLNSPVWPHLKARLLDSFPGFFLLIVILASRQTLLLLIDIADTLISESNRNRTE